MDPILELAHEHNITVIEDAAQAMGAEYKGRRAGSMGDMACFSFYPTKNLGAFGESGMLVTNDEDCASKARILRHQGMDMDRPYYHEVVGGNFRLDELQAAILLVKLPYLDRRTEARQTNAMRYRELFRDEGLDGLVKLPVEKEGRHVYNQFVIEVQSRRDELRKSLTEAGIDTAVYYPVPMHQQPCFEYLGGKESNFPKAEAAAKKTLALPIYAELTDEQQAYVVQKIKAFYSS